MVGDIKRHQSTENTQSGGLHGAMSHRGTAEHFLETRLVCANQKKKNKKTHEILKNIYMRQ